MNHSSLQKFEYNGQVIEQRGDGFVNGTAMCQANGVLIGGWLRLKQTESYIEALASDMQISITELTDIKQGGDSRQQGTWIHPLLALNLGRWISDPFAIWCDRHIKTLIETGSTSLNVHNTDPMPTLSVACGALDLIFANVPIKPELVAGLKLNATQTLLPSIATLLEPSRQLLINTTAQEHELLTPTEIGKRLGLSAIAVNKKLIDMGFQTKNERVSRKEPSYLPTEKGKEFSTLTLASGKGKDNSTFQQLRWYDSIVAFLEPTEFVVVA